MASSRSRRGLLLGALLASVALALCLASTATAVTQQPAFDQVQIGAAGYTRAWGVAVADFNGDGHDDVVTGDTYGDVMMLRGDGTGAFTPIPKVIDAAYHNAYGLAAGDFNGDGKADLAMGCTADGTTDGFIYFYKGNGIGGFASSGYPQIGLVVGDVGTNVTIVAAGDVDGDGDDDLLGGDVTASANSKADVVLFRNMGNDSLGNPTWSAETVISAAAQSPLNPEIAPYYPPTTGTLAGYGLSLGDADGDGDLDLFVTDIGGYVYVWRNTDGQGHFSAIRFENISTRPYAAAWVTVSQQLGVTAGDVNGDARCDVVVGETGHSTRPDLDGKIALYLNEGVSGGKPIFSSTGVIGGGGTDARGLALGQLNDAEDSYTDIVFGNAEGGVYGLFGDLRDTDGDSIMDRYDNLPEVANFPTIDLNGDGGLNAADQIDLDGDGIGSVMVGGQLAGDADADGDWIANEADNLPFVPNLEQLDRDQDGVGEVDGPWPLCTLGDPLDDRDADGDGIPNGPFDPALMERYKAAKQKLMTGDTPIIMRIDALGRWWQSEFTQTFADAISLDPAAFAEKYPKNWDGTFGSGPNPPGGIEGGKSLPVTVMLIPKLLWTDPTVVSYLSDRLRNPLFELGQHGAYHAAIERPATLPDSEMNGYDVLEMYVYMRVGQDTMLGNYSRPGKSDYLSALGPEPVIDWASSASPLVSFAPPYDEFARSAVEACGQLGYNNFSSDIWVEGEDRTFMPDNSDRFDEFGSLHTAATFMPYGRLSDIPGWAHEPAHASYAEYIESHLHQGRPNIILLEEVNFSGKSGAEVDNTIDLEKWANFQTMLDVVKSTPGAVPMTLGEYAMARAYDNAPGIANPDQADENHNGIGDVAEPPVAVDDAYTVNEDEVLSVLPSDGPLANDLDPLGGSMSVSLATGPSHGSLVLEADGAFTYTPGPNFHGDDSFSYVASRGGVASTPAVVSLTVNSVNDAPLISAEPAAQTVQYGDEVAEIEVAHSDVEGAYVVSDSGLPADVAVRSMISNTNDSGAIGGRYFIRGQALVAAGEYPTTFAITDADGATASATETITVVPEDAGVNFDATNPLSVAVPTAGGVSGSVSLGLAVVEADDGSLGDITHAEVSVRFLPVTGGAPIQGTVLGPDSTGRVTVVAAGLPVNAYSVEVLVGGGFYAGSGESVLTVFDPSSGSSSGGGWIAWPGPSDKTVFGFTGAYGKKGAAPRGGLVVVRRTADGIFRLKSNALLTVAMGATGSGSARFGWTSITGKCTYIEPGWDYAEGNCTFSVYAEDRGEPGGGVDRFWVEVKDRSGARVASMSLGGAPATAASALGGGNISVPYRLR